jgi:hypothetical protein
MTRDSRHWITVPWGTLNSIDIQFGYKYLVIADPEECLKSFCALFKTWIDSCTSLHSVSPSPILRYYLSNVIFHNIVLRTHLSSNHISPPSLVPSIKDLISDTSYQGEPLIAIGCPSTPYATNLNLLHTPRIQGPPSRTKANTSVQYTIRILPLY